MRRFCILMLALCFIGLAQAQVGIYRSSGYGAIKKEKVQRPKKPLPTAMIGISAGGGVTASSHIIYPNGAVGFDFAISATPKFALGMFTQYGILENWSFGLQMVGGDFMSHKTAFVGGVGFALNARGRKNCQDNTILMLDADHGSLGRHYQYTRYYSTETFTNNGETVTRTVGFNYEGIAPGLAVRVGFVTPKHFYMLLDKFIDCFIALFF